MLYQTGYLTIRDYNPDTDDYTLGVPDEEVRRDLATLFVSVAAKKDDTWGANLGKMLLHAKWPEFFDGLKALYAAMAYGTTEGRVHENAYGRCLAFLLASCGFRFRMEDVQSDGRSDIVAEHAVMTCVFGLKVGEPVDRAFKQIRDKGYAEPYRVGNRPVWGIGLSFNPQTRRLDDAAAELLR